MREQADTEKGKVSKMQRQTGRQTNIRTEITHRVRPQSLRDKGVGRLQEGLSKDPGNTIFSRQSQFVEPPVIDRYIMMYSLY